MRRHRLGSLRLVAVLIAAAALTLVAFAGGAGGAGSDQDRAKFRWDIVSINFGAGTVSAGGVAAALAHDGSQIVLKGSGTFQPDRPRRVTGGGEWRTFGPGGAQTGSGTYQVTRLVSWVPAPGTPPPLTNRIGDPADTRAGLVHLQIEYSDGSTGVLIVSCHLVGTPDSVFEGITASKGFVTYFDRVAPVPGVDANRTLFHVVR
jgi:hypothetical protein